MKQFKRGILSILWSLLIAIVTPVFIYFIVSIFTEDVLIQCGASGLVFIFLIFQTIFSENIKIEINENNFKYYKNKKLLHDLDLNNYYAGYSAKTSDGTADDLTLQLVQKDNEKELLLDCTSLGQSKFYRMYELVKKISAPTPNKKLETKKRGI